MKAFITTSSSPTTRKTTKATGGCLSLLKLLRQNLHQRLNGKARAIEHFRSDKFDHRSLIADACPHTAYFPGLKTGQEWSTIPAFTA